MSFEHGKNTIAKTDKGLVRGFKKDDVYHFYGIEYGKAERFKRPTETDCWEGVKEATNYSYTCYPLLPDSFGNNLKSPHRYWPKSEDCLNLNLWTKSLDATKKKPVFVWFHGGGFVNGSALDLYAFDGCNLVDKGDCVVVTINHRLNILGYLDLREYGEEYKYSVNVGNWDLICALKWVARNIENFGGDKNNVTIFGQSGGGAKTISVMNMEASAGLYHRAMVLSGVPGAIVTDQGKNNKAYVKRMFEILNVEGPKQLAGFTHRQIADAYLAAYKQLEGKGMPYFGPMKNVDYLGDPMFNGFSEYAKSVSMIVGSNFSEFFNIPKQYDRSTMSDEEMVKAVEKELGKQYADVIIPEFVKSFPDKKILDILAYDGGSFRKAIREFTEARAKAGCKPTYEYFFTPTLNINDGSMPQHNSDISYFFYNTDKVPSNDIGEATKVLESNMSRRLLAFGYNDNPAVEGLLAWPPVTATAHPTMVFDVNDRVDEHLDDKFINEMAASGYYKFRI